MKSNAKMVFEDRTWGCGKGVSAPTRIGGGGGWGVGVWQGCVRVSGCRFYQNLEVG